MANIKQPWVLLDDGKVVGQIYTDGRRPSQTGDNPGNLEEVPVDRFGDLTFESLENGRWVTATDIASRVTLPDEIMWVVVSEAASLGEDVSTVDGATQQRQAPLLSAVASKLGVDVEQVLMGIRPCVGSWVEQHATEMAARLERVVLAMSQGD